MLKSMVPDPGWFNGDQMKFEDWWREIQLFLKSNRVTGTDNKITTILVCLRGDIASIYAQKKLDELDKETDTASWEDFVGELKTIFSDKSKTADAEWKIEMFRQSKKYIADFMIEFKSLAIKVEIGNLHTIFLLKKNIWVDIIKTILEYLLMATLEILKEWKVVITLVRQRYKLTESWQDYQTEIGITYGGRDIPVDIRKARDNFDKNVKSKCFNCNTYGHMAKDYQKLKKEQDTRKYYKYNKLRYIARDCQSGQKINSCSIQEKSDTKKNNKEQSFRDGSK